MSIVLLYLLLVLLFAGCEDMGRLAGKLYGFQGDAYPQTAPCPPAHLTAGHCVSPHEEAP